MRKIILGFAALAAIATAIPMTAAVSTGANAQVVVKERVVIDRDGDRGMRRGGWRRDRDCRTVESRTRRPNGTVVIRKSRVCGRG